ncbi:N-acetylmuramoyl-L-alanine amidase family protein [Clostridium beijerinckii]|uniref:N-acetylmuramoyl-L-alanine amidase family protein n=2 Tax=Clostridium TaxID=1485 RepID=UPI0019D2B0CE|nr:N-acetylmuramoyl-L-alanine amidase family protein [Clostridium beijerinckii]MBN7573280.1 N-acetylmuramoyl-L-alanine amidase family protein [Clostridium beijerinckii]MBN7578619.1 N-acetylmuramoyl-L-alanine amidase family protein [Clostridium beijerinckii]MBN7583053.1 N-acetylmuramoyl-L-alanine amidase family protein [Clostridium beijerinckii]
MFKRATKITSLLVAAASVMSLVPAYAADVKKIDSDDGTVYNAVAYKDGKFFVDGEINDDEEAYYVSNGKFNKLEDVDSGDDAAGDLRKKIKDDTDDRYDEDFAKNMIDENKDDTEDLTKLNILPGAKYKSPWYYTQYKAADKAVNDNVNGLKGTDASKQFFNVYTDTKGGYIDADYNLGKVKVTTTASGASPKTETIENTNDKYDAAGKDDALTASVSQDKILTQDDDYIYRLATIKVNVTTGAGVTARISEINGVELNPTNPNDKPQIFKVENDGRTVSFKAIQKISKAQDSDDVDGAKYAKTVTTYALSDEDGKNLDAKDLFLNTDGTINEDTKFTVANGKLIAYNTEMNEYKKVVVRAYSLKTKGGYYYADEEDESKEDCEVSSQDDKTSAVQTDVDGNLWRLDGGYIYKFDNTDDWDKVYKVDGSFDELSVYDKDNIAAWSEDDDVYSLIGGKSSDDNNTNPPTTTAGWVQAADGTWTYNKEDGTKATGWLNLNGVWYYLNTDGVMATGWLNLNGVWYYLNPSGAMATSWLNLNGTWYYLNSSGAMATGWLNDNGTWYYLNSSGAMLYNTTVDGYVLGSNGAWIR